MTEGPETLGVAEAKSRFAELIDRVQEGERFLILRRGRPAVALVPPGALDARRMRVQPRGLAAGVGALADWTELPDVVEQLYAARRKAKDRPAPELS
jgi:prevent-host-death family protein